MKKITLPGLALLLCLLFTSVTSAYGFKDCDDDLTSYLHLNIYLNTVLSEYTDKDYYKLIGVNLTNEEVTNIASKISATLKREVYKDNKTVFASCLYKSRRNGPVTDSYYKVIFKKIKYEIHTNFFSKQGSHDQLRVIIYKMVGIRS